MLCNVDGPQYRRNCGPKRVLKSKWPASLGQSAGQRAFCNIDGPQHRRNRGPEQFLKSRWPAKSAEPWAKRQLPSRMARRREEDMAVKAEGRNLTDTGTMATTTSTAANSAGTEAAGRWIKGGKICIFSVRKKCWTDSA